MGLPFYRPFIKRFFKEDSVQNSTLISNPRRRLSASVSYWSFWVIFALIFRLWYQNAWVFQIKSKQNLHFQQHSKSTSCSSSSVVDDQKGDHRSTSGSDDSFKKDPLMGSALRVLDINEPLTNILNNEKGDSAEGLSCDESTIEANSQVLIKLIGSLPWWVSCLEKTV